jgi:hypothetical protein
VCAAATGSGAAAAIPARAAAPATAPTKHVRRAGRTRPYAHPAGVRPAGKPQLLFLAHFAERRRRQRVAARDAEVVVEAAAVRNRQLGGERRAQLVRERVLVLRAQRRLKRARTDAAVKLQAPRVRAVVVQLLFASVGQRHDPFFGPV